jgi:hypothetical protein
LFKTVALKLQGAAVFFHRTHNIVGCTFRNICFDYF